MESLRLVIRELRRASRGLGQARWYAATVMITIAASVLMTTVTFALADGVLFRRLPYHEPENLFRASGAYSEPLIASVPSGPRNRAGLFLSRRDISDFEAAVPVARFSLIANVARPDVIGDIRSWVPKVAYVDARFFDVLGIAPYAGGFDPGDFESSARADVPVLVSFALWRTRLGGQRAFGQTLVAEETGTRYVVRGVMSEDFVFPSPGIQPNLLAPLRLPADDGARRRRSYNAIVRLPAGADPESVVERLSAVARQIRASSGPADPRVDRGIGSFDSVVLDPLGSWLSSAAQQRRTFVAVMGLVVVLGIVAWLNVAALVVSRQQDSWKAIVLRRSLGARRQDLAWAILGETFVLTMAGGLLALVLAAPVLKLAVRLVPADLGLLKSPSIDWRVLAVAILGIVLCMLLVALRQLFAAARMSRGILSSSRTDAPQRTRTGRAVIAAQIALTIAVLIPAGLVVGSFMRVRATELGFDPSGVIVAEGSVRAPTPQARVQALASMLSRVREVPGIAGAGATGASILRGVHPGGMFPADTYPVSGGFLETLGVAPFEGRLLSAFEQEDVGVIGADAGDGSRPGPGQKLEGRGASVTIVGTVPQLRLASFESTSRNRQLFVPLTDAARFTLVARARDESRAVMADLLQVAKTTPGVSLSTLTTADELLDDTARIRRFESWALGSIAILAALIAATGALALMAMGTARRRREVAVRMSLGSTPRAIGLFLLRELLWPAVSGAGAGLMLARWAVGLVGTRLYDLTLYEPVVWFTAVGAVLGLTFIAAMVPVTRATRTDPISALREG